MKCRVNRFVTLVKPRSYWSADGRPIYCATGMNDSTGLTVSGPVDCFNESDFASLQCSKFKRGNTELLQGTRGLLLCQHEKDKNKETNVQLLLSL